MSITDLLDTLLAPPLFVRSKILRNIPVPFISCRMLITITAAAETCGVAMLVPTLLERINWPMLETLRAAMGSTQSPPGAIIVAPALL